MDAKTIAKFVEVVAKAAHPKCDANNGPFCTFRAELLRAMPVMLAHFDLKERKPRYTASNGQVYDSQARSSSGGLSKMAIACFYTTSNIGKPDCAAADNYAAFLNAEEEKKRG